MNGLFIMSIIVGLSWGFTANIDITKSRNCFEYVGVIDGYDPFIIFTAKPL